MKTFTLTILILGLTGHLCLAQSDEDSGLPRRGGEDGEDTNLPTGPDDPTPATDPDTNPIPSSCVMAQMRFPWIVCDDDGYYRPLQCINATLCRCVNRFFGTNETEFFPRSASEGRCVQSLDCRVMMNGETRTVPHGVRRNLMINDTCYLIECDNGTLERERSNGCTQVKPDTKCTYRGRELDIGQRVEIECYTCKCTRQLTGDPIIRCPNITCPGDQDSCNCDDEDTDPVCVNGITLRSRCLASCRDGDDSSQVTPGSCRGVDSCQGNTCENGQVCHRREISCVLQTCRRYNCSAACDSNPASSLRVCGSNDMTYPSRCHLESESERRVVRYEGECNTTRCPESAVCGVDGVSYRSRCDAAFRNVRIDYNGRCQKSATDARAQCESVERCENVVRTSRAICPICGGIVTAALDRSVVSEYASANPEYHLDSLAGLVAYANRTIALIYRLARVYGCRLEYDITTSQQPELIYRAVDQTRGKYCADAAKILARYLSGAAPPTSSELETGDELLNQIPAGDTQENFVAAMFSTAAPNFNQQQIENPTSGTPAVAAVAMVTTFLAVILALLNNV